MPFVKGYRSFNCLKLDGKKFGRLKVIKYIFKKKNYHYWECRCDCGKIVNVKGSLLNTGNTKSCGCLRTDNIRKAILKHGMRDNSFYKIWCSMRYRCYNKNQKGYKNWGGRGIKVCDNWLGENGFLNFKKDMYDGYLDHINKYGKRNTCLDRRDNDSNYSKNNCRWVDRFEQNSNTRRNKYIIFNGEELTMSGWARKLGVDRSTILYRIFKANWPLERALCKNL